MHWRFRVLKDDYPTGPTLTEETVWDWCLRVHVAVCRLVGNSEPCETMEWVRQRMAFSVDVQPTRRLREQELFGELRAVTRVALNGAAFLEQEDETVLRVVDLHPWIAEPVGAGNSAVVVDLPRWGPMLSPRVPNLVPIPGPRMERETPGQRPRPNYGHPQAPARPQASSQWSWIAAIC